MKEPGEILIREHQEIRRLLSALDGMADFIRRKDALPDEYMEKAVAVVAEFADKCHHGKEEKALFPAISKASPNAGAELARRLTSDHRAFRKIVESMVELIPDATIKRDSRTLLAKHVSTYSRLLREHMRVEEEQLVPEVEGAIEPAKRKEIAREFERMDEESMGRGGHQKYVDIIDELAKAYGGKT